MAGVLLVPHAQTSQDLAAKCENGSAVLRGFNDPLNAPDSSSVSDTETDIDDAIDLYGNPVIDAVADYRLDSAGSLYESHSPQTEIPKLKSPKT